MHFLLASCSDHAGIRTELSFCRRKELIEFLIKSYSRFNFLRGWFRFQWLFVSQLLCLQVFCAASALFGVFFWIVSIESKRLSGAPMNDVTQLSGLCYLVQCCSCTFFAGLSSGADPGYLNLAESPCILFTILNS